MRLNLRLSDKYTMPGLVYFSNYLTCTKNMLPTLDTHGHDFLFCLATSRVLNSIILICLQFTLKEHVALDRSSWSFKSVCNRGQDEGNGGRPWAIPRQQIPPLEDQGSSLCYLPIIPGLQPIKNQASLFTLTLA